MLNLTIYISSNYKIFIPFIFIFLYVYNSNLC